MSAMQDPKMLTDEDERYSRPILIEQGRKASGLTATNQELALVAHLFRDDEHDTVVFEPLDFSVGGARYERDLVDAAVASACVIVDGRELDVRAFRVELDRGLNEGLPEHAEVWRLVRERPIVHCHDHKLEDEADREWFAALATGVVVMFTICVSSDDRTEHVRIYTRLDLVPQPPER